MVHKITLRALLAIFPLFVAPAFAQPQPPAPTPGEHDTTDTTNLLTTKYTSAAPVKTDAPAPTPDVLPVPLTTTDKPLVDDASPQAQITFPDAAKPGKKDRKSHKQAKTDAKAAAVVLGDKSSSDETTTPSTGLAPALAQPMLTPSDAQSVSKVPAAQKDEFTQALANVYANHPQLKAQREALKVTDETVNEAISGFRPTATAGYSQGRKRSETNQNGLQYQNGKTKSVDVTQPIFNGGGTLASFVSAKDRVKAGRAQLTALEQQILFDAVVAYTTVVDKAAVLKVNQNNVDLLQKQLQATNSRFQVGQLTKTDVAQSQSRLATAQASERQALGDLDSARATFRRVIGYDAPATINLPPVPDSLPQSEEQTVSLAKANEPTLEAARHLEKAASSDIYVRGSTLLPSVDVEGKATRISDPVPGEFRSINDSLMLNVTIPLYQSGAEWARLREARNLAQQAKFTTMDTQDTVIESATRAWQDYNTAKAVIASNQESVRASKVALDGIRQENQYGVRTILDVLNTQQDMFNAQVSLVNARVSEKQAAYRLLASVGKLTARDLKLPVSLNDPQQHYDDAKYKLIGF